MLIQLGLPRAQQNERSALTLLALAGLTPSMSWDQATGDRIGVTPIMEFAALHYGKTYAPNTRETIRRQTIHQFVQAGLIALNPDDPNRPVNSPRTVYQLRSQVVNLLREYGQEGWDAALTAHLSTAGTLQARYAYDREMARLPVRIAEGVEITLSPGGQNVLIKQVIEEFAPRFTPGGRLLYVGDADAKSGYSDDLALSGLGIVLDGHGKMPDVILHDAERNWLVLVEAVTSHGPVDPKRHEELRHLFSGSRAGLVFVTAFLTRAAFRIYAADVAWETEVWISEAPSHLIHFNGERFLGPYEPR